MEENMQKNTDINSINREQYNQIFETAFVRQALVEKYNQNKIVKKSFFENENKVVSSETMKMLQKITKENNCYN